MKRNKVKAEFVTVRMTAGQTGRLRDLAEKLGGESISEAIRYAVMAAPDPAASRAQRRARGLAEAPK